jgi:MscS family membrane protein
LPSISILIGCEKKIYAITDAESVKSDKNTTGAKNVSGLFAKICETPCITAEIRSIYAAALNALTKGFLDIPQVYQTRGYFKAWYYTYMANLFFHSQNPYIAMTLSLVATVIVSFIINWIFKIILKRFAEKGTHVFINQLIRILATPLFLTTLLIGAYISSLPFSYNGIVKQLGTNILASTIFVIWGIAVSQILELLFSKLKQNRRVDEGGVFNFISLTSKLIIGTLVVLAGFNTWGINITPALASAGVMGIALAVAAKDTVANILGGISVFFDKPYKIGDYVIIKDQYRGEVVDIGVRSTKIRTRDNVLLTIPNSVLVTDAVVNETGFNPELRIRIPVSVEYGTDLEKAERILVEVMNKYKRIVKDSYKPRVRYRAFASSGIELEVLGLIAKPAERGLVTHELIKKINKALSRANIVIPYPKTDVYLHTNS